MLKSNNEPNTSSGPPQYRKLIWLTPATWYGAGPSYCNASTVMTGTIMPPAAEGEAIWIVMVLVGSGGITIEPSPCDGLMGPRPVAKIDTIEPGWAGFAAEL